MQENLFVEVTKAVAIAVPAGVLAVALWLGGCVVLQWMMRSKAERVALAQFRLDHPNLRAAYTGKEREGELTIVMIAHSDTRPPRLKYYEVSQNQTAREVAGDAKYRAANLLNSANFP